MKKDVKVAILVSTYNGERYVEEQLNSILKQKTDFYYTIIVRDDGSIDNTINVVKKVGKTNNQIELIEGKNIGLVASFFWLLRYAYNRGFDYYSFCDQDDYWLEDKIDFAINMLENEHEDRPLLYGACSKIVDEKLLFSGYITQKKKRDICFYNAALQNICPGHNQVLNKNMAAIILEGTNELSNIYSQDLWVASVASLTGKIIFDNRPHVLYRMHTNNQLQYGNHLFGWMKNRLVRLKKKEGKKISCQLMELYKLYGNKMSVQEKKDVLLFFRCQRNIFIRCFYLTKFPFYRQKRNETILMYVLYLLGAYKI